MCVICKKNFIYFVRKKIIPWVVVSNSFLFKSEFHFDLLLKLTFVDNLKYFYSIQ